MKLQLSHQTHFFFPSYSLVIDLVLYLADTHKSHFIFIKAVYEIKHVNINKGNKAKGNPLHQQVQCHWKHMFPSLSCIQSACLIGFWVSVVKETQLHFFQFSDNLSVTDYQHVSVVDLFLQKWTLVGSLDVWKVGAAHSNVLCHVT